MKETASTELQSDQKVEPIVQNRSLDDVILLLERDIQHLKLSLETWRLSDHSERLSLIRWHVNRLDQRQMELENLKQLLYS